MANRSKAPFKVAARRAAGRPSVGIIMGSQSDWATMQASAHLLDTLGVAHETLIVSAHRTPDRMAAYAKGAELRGIKLIIAGAGGAAHLPGMIASMTTLPVLGVPVESHALAGLDSLLSIVQMPGGVPVATFAIGEAGAKNAALHAAAILGLSDTSVKKKLDAWRARQTRKVARRPK
jgi:5-(carboxyamino)imidazole ribonucleotide mutase